MRFIDEVKIEIRAGDGGNGAVAFRRERFRPRGGPCGGDGGQGGHVLLIGDRNLMTLLDLRARPRMVAKRGQDGQGNDKHGKGANPLRIKVPVGTSVFDSDSGELVGDITEHGQEVMAARGGSGGRGNLRFVTSSNRAPRQSEEGEKGEARSIKLELKLLADVGLLGFPNVGKSTLISRVSAARPKVADYPFTTLVPNLGVVQVAPGSSFVIADIPGIIPGAAEGAGLGIRFLKHVQRTACILHILAPADDGKNDLLLDFENLRSEVERFDSEILQRPGIVVLNKADLPTAGNAEPDLRRALKEKGFELFFISAITGEGVRELINRLAELIIEYRQRAAEPTNESNDSE